MQRALLIFVFAALPAAAQWRHFGSDQAHATGYFGFGFSSPLNPAARALDTGWNLEGGVGVTNKYVGIMLDAMFNDFGLNHAALFQAGVPHGDQKYWAITVDPVFHVNERGPVDFYITGGGGLYSQITEFKVRDGFYSNRNQVIGSYTVYKPGVDGGAGFAFSLSHYSRVKIFAEARYHYMFTHGSGASFVPVSVGVRF